LLLTSACAPVLCLSIWLALDQALLVPKIIEIRKLASVHMAWWRHATPTQLPLSKSPRFSQGPGARRPLCRLERERLGGSHIIDVADLDAATNWAARSQLCFVVSSSPVMEATLLTREVSEFIKPA